MFKDPAIPHDWSGSEDVTTRTACYRSKRGPVETYATYMLYSVSPPIAPPTKMRLGEAICLFVYVYIYYRGISHLNSIIGLC